MFVITTTTTIINVRPQPTSNNMTEFRIFQMWVIYTILGSVITARFVFKTFNPK